MDAEHERLVGTAQYSASNAGGFSSGLEQAIVGTLDQLVPSAALSYQQTILDLRTPSRMSYRGPAADLRECLREVLDHLAPDEAVTSSSGFVLEKDRTSPTMKQKVRFILRSRGLGKTALESPEASVKRIEDSAGILARSIYNRGSVAAHVSTAREEVLQLKVYVDGVLSELLQIHKRSS